MDAYEKLDGAINEVVNNDDDGSWKDRAEKVLAACDNQYLSEFLEWFEVNDDGEVVIKD